MLNRPSSASNGSAPGSAPGLTIGSGDLDSFKRLLGEIQTAYGREDIDKLAAMTTPEILAQFSQELADNAKQGLRNEISDVNLLQGDLSEAWRENSSDYAMVAMRFSLVDVMFNRAAGHVVSGDRTRPTQATELWTFRRDDRTRADGWQLSAIQQAA
jgi:predicted lipid-binding transport protein (Tim44 family)